MDDLSFSMHGVIAGERQLSKYVVFVIFYNAVSGSLIVWITYFYAFRIEKVSNLKKGT